VPSICAKPQEDGTQTAIEFIEKFKKEVHATSLCDVVCVFGCILIMVSDYNCLAVENFQRVAWGSRPGGRWNLEEKEGCFGTKAQLRRRSILLFSPLSPNHGPAGLLKIPMGRDVGPAAEIWPEPVT
jgi:hypothetical protein